MYLLTIYKYNTIIVDYRKEKKFAELIHIVKSNQTILIVQISLYTYIVKPN